MDESVINIENLVKYFDGRCVLDGINVKVPQGCVYGLLGRNGAGKTTIIRILLGLDFPTRGQTFLLGNDSTVLQAKNRGRIGCVAEGHNLIQHYKVDRVIKLCKDLSLRWNNEFFGAAYSRRSDSGTGYGRPPAVSRACYRDYPAAGPNDTIQLSHPQ